MEYLPTIDLMAVLEEQQGQSRVKVATWVISRILQAVHYAHERGIIHRDIKPGNILAYRTGRHLQVKLADFGLAKCYRDAGLSAMTNEESVRGTIAYMAPEQMSNSRDCGPSVDLFSCGVCLLKFLTGEITEIHTNHSATYALIRTHSRIPDALRPTLERSLQRHPAERFQSAREFAAALAPYLQST
jgi:serine/threonine protein kinase